MSVAGGWLNRLTAVSNIGCTLSWVLEPLRQISISGLHGSKRSMGVLDHMDLGARGVGPLGRAPSDAWALWGRLLIHMLISVVKLLQIEQTGP